jgi:hypothetical protein
MNGSKIQNFSIPIQQLQQDNNASLGCTWKNEELRYKGRMYLRKQSHFKSNVLSEHHALETIGHSNFHKTYEQIKRSFSGKE